MTATHPNIKQFPRPKKSALFFSALACLAAGCIATEALAVDARTLPKGRSRFSVMYGFSNDIQDVFTSEGTRQSAVAEYNIQLSANNFKNALPEIQQLIDALNNKDIGLYYDKSQRHSSNYGIVADPTKPRLGDALERGFLDVAAAGDRAQYNLMYQFGVTDQLSVGFAVPLIKQSINLNAGIVGSNTANDIYWGYASQSPGALGELVSTLDMIRNLSTEQLQTFLMSRDYNRIESQSMNGIGDIVVGGRFKYLDRKTPSGEWISSGQLGMTLPTGRVFDPAEVLAIDFGQGAWDVAAAHIVNYRPVPWAMISNALNFTHRLPTTRAKRVREGIHDVLPDASSQENLDARLGDKFWITAGANFTLTSFLNLDFNYEWYWKGQDVYRGKRTDRDYSYLSEETDLYLETFQVGLVFSSINAFLEYKFPLPADLSLNYYLPVRGRNSVIAPFAALELALYF